MGTAFKVRFISKFILPNMTLIISFKKKKSTHFNLHNAQILMQKWNVFAFLPAFHRLIFSPVAYRLNLLYTFPSEK